MLAEPARYRVRPPEVEAMLVTADVVDDTLAWVGQHGITGYVDREHLVLLLPKPDEVLPHQPPRLAVPFDQYLVHRGGAAGWYAMDADRFEAVHESGALARHRERRG